MLTFRKPEGAARPALASALSSRSLGVERALQGSHHGGRQKTVSELGKARLLAIAKANSLDEPCVAPASSLRPGDLGQRTEQPQPGLAI